jgi:uncharacterized protein YaeQ
VALTATIYNFDTELSDIDRRVYHTLALRLARQPSETPEFMLTRLLAYCLEYAEGIEFTEGVAAGDEPAVLVRDMTGRVTAWIEVGMPDAARLHRGSKLAGRAAVYTHRNVVKVLDGLNGKRRCIARPRSPSTSSAKASSMKWQQCCSDAIQCPYPLPNANCISMSAVKPSARRS